MDSLDQKLDDALRAAEPEIADAGFSERVLGRLPAQRRSRTVNRRWILAGAAGTGSILTMLLARPVEALLGSAPFGPVPVVTLVVLIAIASVPLAWLIRSE